MFHFSSLVWRRLLCAAVLMLAFTTFSQVDPVAAQQTGPEPTPQAADQPVYLPLVDKAPALLDPTPASGALNQSPNVYLAWRFSSLSISDPRFTILLAAWDETPEAVVAENLTSASFDPATFEMDTTYYWRVSVTGSNGVTELGPIWSFHTEPRLDPPPAGSMVGVPAGEFTMGCDPNNLGGTFYCVGWDSPLHKVWLDHYAIDKYEVTNAEYRACADAGKCDPPRRTNSHDRDKYYYESEFALFPVLYVSRKNAIQYCTWAGKRLPTEAEWEKAARGPIDTRPFPWGSESPTCERQNRPDEKMCGPQINDTARIGSYPLGASPYGAMDMSGNVFEWVFDRFQEDWYRLSPYVNPVNPPLGSKDLIVIRGGSYRDRYSYTRTSHRHTGHHGDYPGQDAPDYRSDRVGFRCAMSLP